MTVKGSRDAIVCSFAAQAALVQLRRLTAEIAAVRLNEDLEAIHRSRVASRRLRAVLEVFQDVFNKKKVLRWLKQVRSITRSLGAARDTDVQILFLEEQLNSQPEPVVHWAVKRLHLRWRQKRAKLQKKVLKALDAFEHSEAAIEMATEFSPYTIYPAPGSPGESRVMRSLAREQIIERLNAFLSLQDCLEHPEDQVRLHAMRIAGKKLRYTIEIFSPLFSEESSGRWLTELKQIQDILGSLHDLDVWQHMLPQAMEREARWTERFFGTNRPFIRIQKGVSIFQEALLRQRESQFAEFRKRWQKEKTQALWREIESAATGLIPEDEVKSDDDETGTNPDGENKPFS